MSAIRKNARRLRDLRHHDVPIGGDYRLTAAWGDIEKGTYIDVKTQKEWLMKLGAVNRSRVESGGVSLRLRRGRAA
jgi:hypothetical protein